MSKTGTFTKVELEAHLVTLRAEGFTVSKDVYRDVVPGVPSTWIVKVDKGTKVVYPCECALPTTTEHVELFRKAKGEEYFVNEVWHGYNLTLRSKMGKDITAQTKRDRALAWFSDVNPTECLKIIKEPSLLAGRLDTIYRENVDSIEKSSDPSAPRNE